MRGFHIIPRHQEWDTTYFEEFKDPLYHKEDSAENLAKDARPDLEDLLP